MWYRLNKFLVRDSCSSLVFHTKEAGASSIVSEWSLVCDMNYKSKVVLSQKIWGIYIPGHNVCLHGWCNDRSLYIGETGWQVAQYSDHLVNQNYASLFLTYLLTYYNNNSSLFEHLPIIARPQNWPQTHNHHHCTRHHHLQHGLRPHQFLRCLCWGQVLDGILLRRQYLVHVCPLQWTRGWV